MTIPVFPTLPGQGWSVHKRPTFSTRVQSHVSGREVRNALYSYPLYEWELTFDGLDSISTFSGLQYQSLQNLMGLYLACQGQFGTFLYEDPTDNLVTLGPIGTGDGTTTAFTMNRSLGSNGFSEPVGWVLSSPAPVIYLTAAGSSTAVLQTSGYSLSVQNGLTNLLTFTSPLPLGSLITATFYFAFVCRFSDDQNDFENFMNGLWKVDSLKFKSVRSQ